MLESLTRRGSFIGVTALLLASYAGLGVAAVLANAIAFVILLVCSAGIDFLVEQKFPPVVALFRRAQFGITHRAVVQVFLMLLLVAITDANREMSRAELLVTTAAALTIPGGRIVYMGLLTLARRRAQEPVEFRNLDIKAEYDRYVLPPLLDEDVSQRLLLLSVPPLAAGALAVYLDKFWLFGLVGGVYLLLVGIASLVLLRMLVKMSKRPGPQQVLDEVSDRLHAFAPEVLLYFSGSPESIYQAEMWFRTLERMKRRAAVIVRGRHAVRGFGRTNLPIVCIPGAADLMTFPIPDARLALYVSNVGNNVHFLREPRLKSVFIGHGDSDKVASFNPFSKVYDQVWVAGRAGRDRYARARVGIRDESIVEVGLPPLDELEHRMGPVPTPTVERPLTVLYLPTWEGPTDNNFATSLTHMGPKLVKKLLAAPIPIRVIYKPHPMTGTRDFRAARADERIREMISLAVAKDGPLEPSVTANLESLSLQLADPDLSADDARALQAKWSSLFWRAHSHRHVIVDGKIPPLFDLYNEADVMISDVSSVVSDFMATGKPYLVANPNDLPEDEFREENPSLKAAYLLHAKSLEVDAILGSILTDDPLSSAREREREYLLGPDTPAQERWDDAVEKLIELAEQEWDGEHGAGPAIVPVDDELIPLSAVSPIATSDEFSTDPEPDDSSTEPDSEDSPAPTL